MSCSPWGHKESDMTEGLTVGQGRLEAGGGHYGPPPWEEFIPIRKCCGLNCVPSNSQAEVLISSIFDCDCTFKEVMKLK